MIFALDTLLEPKMSDVFRKDLIQTFINHKIRTGSLGENLFIDYCKIADIPEDILNRLEN